MAHEKTASPILKPVQKSAKSLRILAVASNCVQNLTTTCKVEFKLATHLVH